MAESADETQSEAEDKPMLETLSTQPELDGRAATPLPDAETLEDVPTSPEPSAFRRWVSTLRRKKTRKPKSITPRSQRWTLDDFEPKPASPRKHRPAHHQKQGSHGSSIAFVTAVKSATATLASASIATVSRRNSKWRRAQHSSLLSGSEPRPSVDTQRSLMDEAAKQRSRKRREKVEELVRTEEGYVADLKALSNVPGFFSRSQTLLLTRLILGTVHHPWVSDGHTRERSEQSLDNSFSLDLAARGYPQPLTANGTICRA